MVTVSKVRRLVNSGSKRKLSPLQKLFFGSKRQRAAVKANRGKRKRYKRNPPKGRKATSKYYKLTKTGKTKMVSTFGGRKRRKRRNVSSIVTIWPKGNPGRRKRKRVIRRKRSNKGKVIVVNKGVKMARRKNRSRRKNYSRRKRNVVYRGRVKRGMYKYSSNPGRRRRRHSVARRRHHSYRRNPGMLTGTIGRVAGVIGGVAVTKVLMGFVPAAFTTGVLGYLATGVVAFAQGKLVGKVSKNSTLGNDFMVGGFAYLAAKVLNDFFPSIGAYTGISGMGLIGGSSFYVPQVNVNGSMGNFQVPSAVMGALPAPAPVSANASLGRLRRTGKIM